MARARRESQHPLIEGSGWILTQPGNEKFGDFVVVDGVGVGGVGYPIRRQIIRDVSRHVVNNAILHSISDVKAVLLNINLSEDKHSSYTHSCKMYLTLDLEIRLLVPPFHDLIIPND